eukprot:gene2007-biopygen1638
MEDSSLREKVLQALFAGAGSIARRPAGTSEADSVVEAALPPCRVPPFRSIFGGREARLTTKVESQMEQLTQMIITRLSPATAQPSATSVEPVPPGIAAKQVDKEADLFPGFPVVGIAAWKGLLGPASARGRRAILRWRWGCGGRHRWAPPTIFS